MVKYTQTLKIRPLLPYKCQFSNNLRTEEGADIEGYIKKSSTAGKKETKSAGDFLFSKPKEDKKVKKNGKQTSVTNKETEALV